MLSSTLEVLNPAIDPKKAKNNFRKQKFKKALTKGKKKRKREEITTSAMKL